VAGAVANSRSITTGPGALMLPVEEGGDAALMPPDVREGSQGDVEKNPECTTCRVPAEQVNLKLINTAPALPAPGLQIGGGS
jgi:hypothetical protein